MQTGLTWRSVKSPMAAFLMTVMKLWVPFQDLVAIFTDGRTKSV
jgi:hypothetical protein